MAIIERNIADNLDQLLEILPPDLVAQLRKEDDLNSLLEVVLDLGRRPEARFPDSEVTLLEREVTEADIAYVVEHIGSFGDDNRAGIERTLHRISAVRNRAGRVVGLTCRVGRSVFGTIEILRDHIEAGRSILIMGRPGVGKTTMLREAARVMRNVLDDKISTCECGGGGLVKTWYGNIDECPNCQAMRAALAAAREALEQET